MQLGVISDTHDNIEKTIEALDIFLEKSIFIVLHCGDWVTPETFLFIASEAQQRKIRLCGVLGNNDIKYTDEFYAINSTLAAPVDLPKKGDEYIIFKVKDREFGIYHGHKKIKLDEILQTHRLEALFVGHTHKPSEDFIRNTKVLNPGALSYSIPFKKRNNEIFTIGIYDLKRKVFEVHEI
ncbi:MAG: phosphodiesterase [Candidatus Dojkabacteria bacterium]|nr:MAG: phosphodiesterase [Candidatus Dojkabacteria bacterium]